MFEMILNRWRGTGDIFSASKVRVTGTAIYALYLFIVISLISAWYFGLGFAALFLAGESYAWELG